MAQRSIDTEYKVQVLDRAFAILNALAGSDASLGATEIGQRLKLNKSTVHRLLAVLERNRYVERDLESGRYRLGLKLVELGSVALSRFDLHRLARPFVERLAKETGETAHLGILRGVEVISLVNAEGHHTVRMPSTVGRRSPIHCTSQGKLLLAEAPDTVLDNVLRSYRFVRYTDRTIRDGSSYRAELRRVREAGYALDDEEFEDGLKCVGAPIRDHTGKVVAAISIAAPAFRVTEERLPELIRSVTKVAADLSAALGDQTSQRATARRAAAVEASPRPRSL